MLIFTWIWCIAIILASVVLSMYLLREGESPLHLLWIALLVVVLAGGPLFILYGTESGRRAQKTFESNFFGGLERTVEVYDMNGSLIKSYEGTFDVDHTTGRIIFDDQDGKRHLIYYPTGTVIIDDI